MRARAALLPTGAAGLVAAVLAVQIAAGGGDFVPTRAADPCAERSVAAVSDGIDGLAEQLVLLGLDGAACRLGVSRESLVIGLAAPGERSDAEIDAVRGGLLDAVDRLEREGRLPRASALADEALEQADLPTLVATAARALPDSLIDSRLDTGDVLRRTVAEIDIRRLLGGVTEPAQVQTLVRDAVVRAAVAEALQGLPIPSR